MLRFYFAVGALVIGSVLSVYEAFWGLTGYIGLSLLRPETFYGDFMRLRPLKFLLIVTTVSWFLQMFRRTTPFRWTVYMTLMTGLLGATYLSTQWAIVSKEISVKFNHEMIIYVMTIFLILNLVRTSNKFRIIAGIMLLGCVHFARIGIYQALTWGPDRIEDIGGRGDLTSSNAVASYLVMMAPLALIFIRDNRKAYKIFGIGSLAASFITLVLTKSRGGFLGCLAAGCVYIYYSKNKGKVLAVSLSLVILAYLLVPDAYWDRISTIQTYEEDASSTGRLELWSTGVKMWELSPWVGIGQGNFRLLSPKYTAIRSARTGRGQVAHNTYVQFLTEGGLLTFGVFLTLLIVTIRDLLRLVRLVKMNQLNITIGTASLALLAGFIGVLVCAVVQSKNYHAHFYWFFGLTPALKALAQNEENRRDDY